ncbi:MAG: hypothetical protein ACI3XQ_12490 [Eubacteriales bacterium]
MKKRILCLIFVVLLLAPGSLLSCRKEKDDGETTSQAETEETETDFGVPVKKISDGEPLSVNILTLNGSTLLEGGENDTDVVSRAIHNRTTWIEENYGVDLELTLVPDGSDYSTMYNSYMGGLRTYDMLMPHCTKFISSFLTSGMLADLNEMNYINTSKPWWNQSQVENFTVNGKLFFGTCDFTLNRRGTNTIVANRDKYANMNYGNSIYDVVLNGEWTMERMKTICVDAADEEKHEYGLAFNVNLCSLFYYSSGETLLKRGDDGKLVLKFDVRKCNDIAEKVYNILIGPQTLQDAWYNSSFASSEGWKAFSNGSALLLSMDITEFGHMIRQLDFNTAFLPYPKLEEGQKDYCSVSAVGIIGIPADAKDPDCSALILEACNIFSYNNFREVYFNNYLSYQLSRDERDYKILEMILDNTIYDLGYTLDLAGTTQGRGVGMLKSIVIDNLNYNASSYIKKYEEPLAKLFDETISKIY